MHFLSLAQISRAIRRREITSTAVVEHLLTRIEQLEPKLHSYTTVMIDSARAAAKIADAEIARGFNRGPLHGVPVGIKDLCFTVDAPTAGGMPLLHAHTNPGIDATVVARLRAAGAIVIGKLALTEGATGEHHPAVTAPCNPWQHDYWTGVSSSGSGVAVAAGLCFGALGSDTAGSIRLPSACNGVTGLKPTWGRVSRHGIFDFAASMDHLGPMARTAEDVALMLQVLAGADANDPTAAQVAVPDYLQALSGSLQGLRVGIDRKIALTNADDEIVTATATLLDVLRELGATIVDMTLPLDDALRCFMPIVTAEIAEAHRATFPQRADAYGPALRAMLEIGHTIKAVDLAQAQAARLKFSGRLAASLQNIDAMILPVMRRRIPSLAEHEANQKNPALRGQVVEFTVPFDLSGSPSLTVPAGFDRNGLPIGMQIVGKHFSEDVLLKIGHAFQQRTDWHTRHPLV